MEIEVYVKAVVMDQKKNHIVLLEDTGSTKILPIWIGPYEAQAIALPLQEEEFVRPLTHDLFKNLCDKFQGELEKVLIKEINQEGTYLAELHLKLDGKIRIMDARPSDAIALALRSDAPIFLSFRLVEFTIDPENLHMQNSD